MTVNGASTLFLHFLGTHNSAIEQWYYSAMLRLMPSCSPLNSARPLRRPTAV